MSTFDYVYRWKGQRYAQRCRIIALSRPSVDRDGGVVHHTGHESVAVEFEDGTKAEVQRQQILLATALQARQIIAKAARGGKTRIGEWRTQQARQHKETP